MDWGRTLEELKRDFAAGIEILGETEYLGENGLPYCTKCKTRRFFASDDGQFAVRCNCKCEQERYEREEKERRADEVKEECERRKRLSLLGDRYKDLTFKNAIITEQNKKAYEKCKNYVEKCNEVFRHNIGLYLYGSSSSGKTFLTAILCNELILKGYRCVYTSLALILDEMKGSSANDSDLLYALQNYDFAFIDDLGKEFLGREYNAGSAKWAESSFFKVINARYNAQKPTIFSSNYAISELASSLNLDTAIVERINEMSTRAIRLEGNDFRKKVRENKNEIAKSLGI